MHRDQAAGGNVPTHGGEALVEFAEGIERISPYRIENWAMLPACHMGLDRLWSLRQRVKAIADSGAVKGIVITHGTDTLEETAYLLDRTLNPKLPVAMTGAMRTSSDAGWDGPRNLLDAAVVAAADTSAGRGVMVVFHGKVLAGATAVKTHATDPDAFSAPHSTPLGRVDQGQVKYQAGKRGGITGGNPVDLRNLSAKVALIPMVVGDQGRMLDLTRADHDGLVVVAFGSGNMPPGAVPAISRWIHEGKPVVLASRCPAGAVTPLYAFDGGGARLVALGAIPAGSRTPSQAWMELTISLSAGTVYGV